MFILFAPKRDSSLKLEFIVTRRLEEINQKHLQGAGKKIERVSLKSKCGNHRGLFAVR